MGTSAPQLPQCCPSAALCGDTDGDQEEQSEASLPGSWGDAMAHGPTSSQNSLDGEGPGDPAQSTPGMMKAPVA